MSTPEKSRLYVKIAWKVKLNVSFVENFKTRIDYQNINVRKMKSLTLSL